MKEKRSFVISTMLIFVLSAVLLLSGCDRQTDPTTASQLATGTKTQDIDAAKQGVDSTMRGAAGHKIVVGMDATFPPMIFRAASGQLQGYDFAVMREVFQRMKQPFEVREVLWTQKEQELNNGTIDLVLGMRVNDQNQFLFSRSYLSSPDVIVVSTASPFSSKEEITGKTVGILADASAEALVRKAVGHAGRIVEYQERVLTLSRGIFDKEVDAVLVNGVMAKYYAKNSPGAIRIIEAGHVPAEYGLAARNDNADLIKKVNQALESMEADGTIQKLQVQWLDDLQ
ncbi:MAG: transporter substrate-binding domain-containing protein [bacterium]|nr:transporter substrate-binding domain-containing protein [bacterium]